MITCMNAVHPCSLATALTSSGIGPTPPALCTTMSVFSSMMVWSKSSTIRKGLVFLVSAMV